MVVAGVAPVVCRQRRREFTNGTNDSINDLLPLGRCNCFKPERCNNSCSASYYSAFTTLRLSSAIGHIFRFCSMCDFTAFLCCSSCGFPVTLAHSTCHSEHQAWLFCVTSMTEVKQLSSSNLLLRNSSLLQVSLCLSSDICLTRLFFICRLRILLKSPSQPHHLPRSGGTYHATRPTRIHGTPKILPFTHFPRLSVSNSTLASCFVLLWACLLCAVVGWVQLVLLLVHPYCYEQSLSSGMVQASVSPPRTSRLYGNARRIDWPLG